MMFHLTRMAGIILASGFFFSCTVLESVRQPNDEAAQTLEAELQEVEQQIRESEEPELYIRKGEILSRLASRSDDPSDRTPRYREMRSALVLVNRNAGQFRRAEQILTDAWSREQNRGVEIIGRDTTSDNRELGRAAEHFGNAVVIRPDSAISYRMKAQAHYRNGDPEAAVATLEEAREQIPDLPARLLEQLAFLHMEAGRFERAIALYESAETTGDRDRNILHGLANAYMESADHRKSVELLNHLIDLYPQNIHYGQARATELYFLGREVLEERGTGAAEQSDSLFRAAEIQYNQLVNIDPENGDIRRQAADFFQNVSALYRAHGTDDDEADTETTERIEHYLSASIPHFEYLISETADEERSDYVQRLLTIYTWLGMDDRAMELRSKY